MWRIVFFSVWLLLAGSVLSFAEGAGGYPICGVPFTSVHVDSLSLFGQRLSAVRAVTIPLAFSKCSSEGRYDNFVKAAAPSSEYVVGDFMGYPFDDTDVYKTIEGASYLLQTYPDASLEQYIDSVLDIVAAAQEADGYLYTARTINPLSPHPWSGTERWESVERGSHELYNLGHMVLAACAHYAATGNDKFLTIARRFADCVCRSIGPEEGQRHVVPGHQIAEMALVQLYCTTGDAKYLSEAQYFLSLRGTTPYRDPYSQSHLPVCAQTEAVGHAVRAGYMYAGMADVAALTGDSAYLAAIDRLWTNIVSCKSYITGGIGSRHDKEAFGDNYELPNLTAYAETCAAIAMVYLHHRMFLLHGDAKYIDCLERTLYNAVFCGMSLDGGRFFYVNPLSADGTYAFNYGGSCARQPWFGCACCPSNLCRFIPSLPGYMYAVTDDALYVNLYGSSTTTVDVAGGALTLSQHTDYPYDEDITLTISAAPADSCTLMLRLPGWAQGSPVPSDLYRYADSADNAYSLTVNGEVVAASLSHGYLAVCRRWQTGDTLCLHLAMPVRRVVAHPLVAADAGLEAFERGPIVYCLEQEDSPLPVSEVVVDDSAPCSATYVPSLFGGVSTLSVSVSSDDDTTPRSATLIPYYAWNHRGVAPMSVWLPHH